MPRLAGFRYLQAAALSLLLMVGVTVAGAAVPATGALFSASADNSASTWSTTSIYSPAGLTATVVATTVTLNWNAAQPNNNGNGNGYAISAVNVGSGACPTTAAGFTSYLGSTPSTTLTFVDATFAAASPGSFVCYLVQTGYNPAGAPPWAALPVWTSSNTLPTARVTVGGFEADSVAFANAGTAGNLDAGDTITITFSQAVNTTGLPANKVCVEAITGAIYLDEVTLNPNKCSTTYSIGVLNGGTITSSGNNDGVYSATYTWSNGNRTLTITIGALTGGKQSTVNPATRTLTPAGTLVSGGGSVICTTGAACQPTTTTLP